MAVLLKLVDLVMLKKETIDQGGSEFEITSHGVTLSVKRMEVAKAIVYQVIFSSKRKAIVVTKATDRDATQFWTSIPEGRQREAEGVGKLIDEYYQKAI